jgi:hypothetical protein
MGRKKSKSRLFLRTILRVALRYVKRSLFDVLRETKFFIFTAHFALSGQKNEGSYD